MNTKSIVLKKEAKHKRLHTIWLDFYEIHKQEKFIYVMGIRTRVA